MTNKTYYDEAREIHDWITQLRRQLHRFPELMYEEVKTSELVRQTLDELGILYRHPMAKTGLVASLGNGQGPCVALRADMDALPIHEEADVSFRSEYDGKMHACGHDCHTAMLLGAARLLKQREAEINGTVKLIFQPAEEGGAGGQLMRDEGAFYAGPAEGMVEWVNGFVSAGASHLVLRFAGDPEPQLEAVAGVRARIG